MECVCVLCFKCGLRSSQVRVQPCEARLIRKQLVLEGPVLMNGLVPVLGK